MDGTFISFRRAIKCLQIYDLAWSQSLDQSDYNPANRNPAMPRSYVSLLIWTYVICQKLIATVPQSSTQHSHLRIANVYSEIKLKYNMIKVWRANNFEVDHIRDSLWWKTVWCIFGVFWKCPALDLVTGTLGSHDCWTLSSCFFSPSLSWCIPPREPLLVGWQPLTVYTLSRTVLCHQEPLAHGVSHKSPGLLFPVRSALWRYACPGVPCWIKQELDF